MVVCRCLLSVLTLLLPLAVACAQDRSPARYFPLEVGKVWRYQKTVVEDGKKSSQAAVVVRVIGKEEFDLREEKGKKEKAQAFTLEAKSADEKAASKKLVEKVAVLADGVYRRSAAGKAITPPMAFLKLTNSWTVDSTTNDTPIKGTFTLGREDVKVPAGTFPGAVTVAADMLQIGEKTMSVKYWFALDVGVVKQQIRVGSYEVTLELQGK